MIQTKRFNNISKEVLNSIPPLLPGQVAEYRLLGVQPDRENNGGYKIPALRGVRREVQVFEKGQTAPKKLAFVVDVQSKTIGDNEVITEIMRPIWFRSSSAGSLFLSGDKGEDVLLHEFLYLSPERKGSPFQRADITPVYEYIDHEADARQAKEKRDIRRKAIANAVNLTEEQLAQYAFLFGSKPSESIDVQRNAVEQYAEDHPEKFLQIVSDETSFEIQVAFKKAKIDGLIVVTPTKEVRWAQGNKMIAKLPSNTVQENEPQKFAEWAAEHGDNKDLADMIVKAVSEKKTTRKNAKTE